MVARICVAYASEAAKAKVAGVCLLLLLQFDEE
jgi:hypothetical protein